MELSEFEEGNVQTLELLLEGKERVKAPFLRSVAEMRGVKLS